MINNRQAGRRRGRGGQQQRSQGGNPGRPDNGNRIDNRARGNAAQLLEKYKTLARDAQMQGDRVNVEYYLQFADHYFRVLAETRARFEENGGQPQGRRPQGATLDDDDQEYEDEGDRGTPDRMSEQQDARQDNPRHDNVRQDHVRQDNRGGSPQYNGNRDDRGPREDRPRENRPRDDYPRDDRGQRENRGNANGNGEYRDERPARAPRPEQQRAEVRFEPVPEIAKDEIPALIQADEAPAEAPRRGRGRPRREVVVEDMPQRDAEHLPASLGLSAIVSEAGGEGPAEDKPRRRRGRPPASAAAE